MPGPVGNESNHSLDGLTVRGGLALGVNGPYLTPEELNPFGMLSPRNGGIENFPRFFASGSNASTTQRLHLNYFTAPYSKLITSIEYTCAGTIAGATPSILRYGLFTVSLPSYDLTLAASTTNDTTMLAIADTAYPKAISSPAGGYQLVAGTLYAMGFLCVSGAALPTLCGPVAARAGVQTTFPLFGRFAGSQADLPATLAHTSTTASTNIFYWFAS